MPTYILRLDRFAKYGLLGLLFYVPLTVGAGSFTDTKGIIFAVITVVAAAWLLLRWEEGGKAQLSRSLLLRYVMLCFLAVSLLFFLRPVALRESLTAFFVVAAYFVTYGIISTRVKDESQVFIFLWVLTISATLVAIKGINQYLYEFEALSHHIASNALPINLDRQVFSTFISANALAGFLLLCLPSAFLLSRVARSSRQRIFALAATGIMMVTLVLTLSRAGIALSVVLFIVMALASPLRSWRNFLVTVIALAIMVGVLVGVLSVAKQGELAAFRRRSSSVSASASLSARMAFWEGAWKMALASPWHGNGLGTFASAFSRFQITGAYSQHAHNSYLEVLAETGFVGAALFLVLIALVFGRAWNTFRSSRDAVRRQISLGLWVGMLGFLLHNLVDFDWYVPAIGLYFWALAGLAASPGLAQAGIAGLPAVASGKKPAMGRLAVVGVSVVAVLLLGRYFLSLSQADTYGEMGKAALREGAWDRAVVNLKEAVRRDSLEAHYHNLLAQAYAGQASESGDKSRLLRSVEEMEKAVQLQPTSASFRGLLGSYYFETGETSKALREWQKAKSLAPQSPTYYNLAGSAYLEMGDTRQAIREFSKAVSYARLYRQEKTASLLKRSAQSAPRSVYEAYLRLAAIDLQQGREKEALAFYNQAISFDPGEVAGYHGKAAFYANKQDYPEAMKNYLKVLELDPRDLTARFRLGLVYESIGQYEQAAGQYREILRIKPDVREAEERLKELLRN